MPSVCSKRCSTMGMLLQEGTRFGLLLLEGASSELLLLLGGDRSRLLLLVWCHSILLRKTGLLLRTRHMGLLLLSNTVHPLQLLETSSLVISLLKHLACRMWPNMLLQRSSIGRQSSSRRLSRLRHLFVE